MSELEPQSFIIKVWLEETSAEAGAAIWRGHITHVPSGQRRYLQNLGSITDFVTSHLEDMSVKLGVSGRWKIG